MKHIQLVISISLLLLNIIQILVLHLYYGGSLNKSVIALLKRCEAMRRPIITGMIDRLNNYQYESALSWKAPHLTRAHYKDHCMKYLCTSSQIFSKTVWITARFAIITFVRRPFHSFKCTCYLIQIYYSRGSQTSIMYISLKKQDYIAILYFCHWQSFF